MRLFIFLMATSVFAGTANAQSPDALIRQCTATSNSQEACECAVEVIESVLTENEWLFFTALTEALDDPSASVSQIREEHGMTREAMNDIALKVMSTLPEQQSECGIVQNRN